MDSLLGIKTGDWWRLLRENQFAVDQPHWGRAARLTLMSLVNSVHHRREERLYGEHIRRTEIKPPIFILGHWRSGTTLLHSLLAVDERLAYPTLFQVSNPHTFLYREKLLAERLADTGPQERPMDNVQVTVQGPGEDEFATSQVSLRSPLIGWSFPRREEYYDRYLTFREVPEEEVDQWKGALVTFLRKLTWNRDRLLLLKSPTHTGRIRLLLELFPEARFIHIHRHPYAVFQSTQRLYEKAVPHSSLQRPDGVSVIPGILGRYADMYDAFFEERSLIPDGQYAEISFEELAGDMVGQIAGIYDRLDLPGFQGLRPTLQRYVESIADYERNVYAPLAKPLRRKITTRWQRSFQEWGYTQELVSQSRLAM